MFKQITINEAEEFRNLIVNMYSHLENLEWFSPMPFDIDNVKRMIENPRFYIVGYYENNILCGVSSFDYKCGKLIGKVEFPSECDTSKLVEIGFTMVHSNHQGKGIMKQMISFLLEKAKNDGIEWVFSKVHKNNLASSTSFLRRGFTKFLDYKKPIDISDFKQLSSEPFFSQKGKENAKITLSKISEIDTEIIVDYEFFIKKI